MVKAKAKALMVQGTASYAGKSFLVAVLCKIFRDAGYRVAPFKSQNTSLNSYVTPEGFEIARAQALQALAAGIEPSVEMNPILVKPMGESRAQVILNGRPYADMDAANYYRDFTLGMGIEVIKKAYEKLSREYEVIVIEGAGSPVEINLYERDVANMRIAELADAPVLLVADIDRGGVFASIYGTIALLSREHRERVRGVVINKFRGSLDVLKPGLEKIEELIARPVLGVIPFIHGLKLPFEDSVSLGSVEDGEGSLDVAVLRFPRISNFTDFDPLLYEGARVRYVDNPSNLGCPDVIILPGTKNTFRDLEWLRAKGFEEKIKALVGKVKIVGLCGGYQMLGRRIVDESGVEKGAPGEVRGLGLLDVETRFKEYSKTTRRVEGEIVSSRGVFRDIKGHRVRGYEIHMGETTLGREAEPIIRLQAHLEGATNKTGDVFGTYLHGIFDLPPLRKALLNRSSTSFTEPSQVWAGSLERAARVVRKHLDLKQVYEIMGLEE
jgi:adenosylcobyric acid synthase